MFISRRAHEALIHSKDDIIAKQAEEITWLRRMIQPDRALSHKVNIEADLVLEGRQDQVTDERRDVVESERALILSGNY